MRLLVLLCLLALPVPARAGEARQDPIAFAGGSFTIEETADGDKILAYDGRQLARNYFVFFDREVEVADTAVALFSVGDGGNQCAPAQLIAWKPDGEELQTDIVGDDCGAPSAAVADDRIVFVPYVAPGATATVWAWTPDDRLFVAGSLAFAPEPGTGWADFDGADLDHILDAMSNEAIYKAARQLLGGELSEVAEGLGTGGAPETGADGIVFASGCVPHACGGSDAFMAVDPKARKVYFAQQRGKPEPMAWPALKSWPAELRRAMEGAIGHRADARQRSEPLRRLISTGSPFEKTAGYSRAVVDGDWCFVAGTTGYDYVAMTMPESVEAQARNALATIAQALSEAGFALGDVVRTRYYVTDRAFVHRVYPILGDIRAAATMLVCGLAEPEMKIEIEATALRRSSGR